jgi:hypothetical protein
MKPLVTALAVAALLGVLLVSADVRTAKYGPDPGPEEDRAPAVTIVEGG